jgi:isopenicillin N synthase-like dioxygenase
MLYNRPSSYSPQFRGYSSIGTERTNNQPDNREQIDFGLETTARPKDPARLYASLHGPNQWPDEAANPSIAGLSVSHNRKCCRSMRLSSSKSISVSQL